MIHPAAQHGTLHTDMANNTSTNKPVRFGFLLLPHASMADLAIATEVLTRANQLAEQIGRAHV